MSNKEPQNSEAFPLTFDIFLRKSSDSKIGKSVGRLADIPTILMAFLCLWYATWLYLYRYNGLILQHFDVGSLLLRACAKINWNFINYNRG